MVWAHTPVPFPPPPWPGMGFKHLVGIQEMHDHFQNLNLKISPLLSPELNNKQTKAKKEKEQQQKGRRNHLSVDMNYF